MFYVDDAYILQWLFQVFLCVFLNVSDAYFKCFICLQTHVANVSSECIKSRSDVRDSPAAAACYGAPPSSSGRLGREVEGARAVPAWSQQRG
jgi:hypothetical protein